ncbi:MAG: PDR/VanB family oxidoreductase [Sneathiellales bacterium]|nr:PDR/VanB family oxidoreductase [Sneathiellales bacterium]
MTYKQKATVIRTKKLSSDVMRFDLVPHGEGVIFEPGGHIDVFIPNESGEIVRSYSHVGIGTNRTLQIAVKQLKNSRGGSRYMWSLAPGDHIQLAPGRNNFPLSYGAPVYQLLAGGIGITPILGMGRALKEARKNFRLLYCVRDGADAAFVDTLREEFAEAFVLHDDLQKGILDASAFVGSLAAETELYMCGPLPLMDAVSAAWGRAGRAPAKLRFETFGTTGNAESMDFKVTVIETGETVTVPRDASLLDSLIEAGQPVMYDCKRGECGLCKVEIEHLQGDIDHRDVFLSESDREHNTSMCSCVSRLKGGHARIHIDSISHGPSAHHEVETV